MYEHRVFLDGSAPSVVVEGWYDANTVYSGEGQTWVDEHGNVRPLNIADPHYCHPPYNNDYKYATDVNEDVNIG